MDFRKAPISKDNVLSAAELVKKLATLIGEDFKLSNNPKTNGSKLRKLISATLDNPLKSVALKNDYEVLSKKGKGVPRLLAELIDTYIITTGKSYNLQVWNRFPNSSLAIIRYNNGEIISPSDIRFILVKIDTINEKIDSIVILTPAYIENKFGVFGKPTIKNQLLVSEKERIKIITGDKVDFRPDTLHIASISQKAYKVPTSLAQNFDTTDVLSLDVIRTVVADKLIGSTLNGGDTKTRGQALERKVLDLLGYGEDSKLVGGYPDVPNQLLEVKVQDAQTIDLGLYSPQFKEPIAGVNGCTTEDIRYLIALTNAQSHIIEGIILSSGLRLGDRFSYVSDKSFKCQRSIPMDFFEKYKGQCVFNPQDQKQPLLGD